MPLVLYANDDLIIEVANCDQEQGGWHRNMGADEWAFQYKGSRTLNSETGPITINEGEMTVIPRGISHQNVGLGPNIEITIYSRNPLKRLAPLEAKEADEDQGRQARHAAGYASTTASSSRKRNAAMVVVPCD